jgi:hypothetical protein
MAEYMSIAVADDCSRYVRNSVTPASTASDFHFIERGTFVSFAMSASSS